MTSSTSSITAMRPSARVLITLLAALSMVFAQLVGFAASPASGSTPTPTEISGNDTAANCPTGTDYVKYNDPSTGSYTVDGETINLTISSDVASFTTSSNLTIYAVLVKGGSSFHEYDYGQNGTSSGSGLVAPDNSSGKPAGISHISFCYDVTSTAVNPTVNQSEECEVEGTYTIPDTTGVQYKLDGDDIAPETYDGPIDATLTAEAKTGYTLSNPDFSFDIVITAAEDCDDERAPVFIDVDKVFSDDISEEDEPSFHVDLTTDPECDHRVTARESGEYAPCSTFIENDGDGRNEGGPIPISRGDSYSVEETMSPPGYSPRSSTIGDFNIDDLLDTEACSIVRGEGSDSITLDQFRVVGPESIICTHTVINDPPTITTSTPRNPEIDIVKTAVSADVDFEFVNGVLTVTLEEGESAEITYEYVITNEGNESLDTLGLDDDVIGELTDEFVDAVDEEYNSATFPVNGEVTVTATYTTTAADLAAGSVTNVATVTGTGVISNDDVDAEDDEIINIIEVQGETEVAPDISIVKSAVDGVELNEDGQWEIALEAGESLPVTYEYVITNTGEDDLTELTLMDDKIGDLSEAFRGAVINEYGVAVLPVGGSVTVTAVHDVALGDFANGTLTNVATVTGIGVESEGTVTDDDDETVVSIEVLGETEEDPPVTPVADTTETHPRTGFDTGALTSLGLLLAAIGAGVLLLGRRREEGDVS